MIVEFEKRRLQEELNRLSAQNIGMHSGFPEAGYWLIEIGKLNLEIAKYILSKDKE